MGSSEGVRVAVVGSANLDVVVTVERFPAPGETVLGGELVEIAGGKGLNQAVAAARRAPSALVGCVGDDDAGRLLLSTMQRTGVVTDHVRHVGTPTGRAFIQVSGSGENSIVVAPAANAELTVDQVAGALDELGPVVVLCQLEVPVASVLAAAEWASASGARFVLNPSPVQDLPDSLVELCDPLVVNAGEAAHLLGAEGGADVADLTAGLAGRSRSVVVTDGPRGAHVGSSSGIVAVPGVPAEAVDTTGAGDEFAGCLAAAVAGGESLVAAAEAANRAAARVVGLPRAER
ncbi:MAG TPA: ribokinase [Nocardioides sp.]|nr:ribokinase [Nocardioides sp.]